VAPVRSCRKLPPCPTHPVPAGSSTDLPLAKAEPIGDGDSVSAITRLRTNKNKLRKGIFVAGERSESSADTKVSAGGRGRREIALQPWGRPWWAGCASAAHGGIFLLTGLVFCFCKLDRGLNNYCVIFSF